jgi:hypothetical protein
MPHSAKGSAATGTAFAYTDNTTASAIATGTAFAYTDNTTASAIATGTAFAYTDNTTASAIAAPFAPVVLCVLHPVDHLQH